MTKKQTKLSDQPRQHKLGAHKRARKRRNKHLKYIARNRVRNIKKGIAKRAQAPHVERKGIESMKWLWKKIWGKLRCFIGIHSWVLSSGLPGTPKFMCRKCMKKSKILWSEKDNHAKNNKTQTKI